VLFLLLVAACGRWDFAPIAGDAVPGGRGGDGSARDGLLPPAEAGECVADGTCPAACFGMGDPDCVKVCGDGVCAGNAGESCVECASDCKTTADVCGNGQCDPDEDSATCYVDCGPSPWTWSADEASTLMAINAARTGGTTCPGMAMMTAPPLALDLSFEPIAHEWVWEISHEGYESPTKRCNGRTLISTEQPTGISSTYTSEGPADGATLVAQWQADMNACPQLMAASLTEIFVAEAHDTNNAYVIVMH
jgi:hypothetical protein